MVYLKIHHPSGFYKVIGVRLVHSHFKLLMLNIILVPTARLELAQPKATTPSRERVYQFHHVGIIRYF